MRTESDGGGKIMKDTVLYMIAKALEGFLGIAAISLLTYLFTEEAVGQYALWNIAATTLAMMAIQWLSQSASRYLNEYELSGDTSAFYSTVFFSWLKVNLTALAVAIAGIALFWAVSGGGGFSSNSGFHTIFPLAVLYFMTYNTSQLLIALLSVKRRVVTNLVISVTAATVKLAMIYGFCNAFGAKISIIFLSYILSDLIVTAIALTKLNAHSQVKRGKQSKTLSREFGRYGAPLVGNLATTTVLNNSDRFIIQRYLGEATVGIYTTNYSIISAVFTMLQAAMMRGSYPTILKAYAAGEKEQTETLVSFAVRNYLIIAVPAVVGIGVLSTSIATLLFKASYVPGSRVMLWTALGMMFLGLTEYSNKPWELSARTSVILRNSLISGAANLLLNIAFIGRYGYMVAAYSTFAGFFVYFCLSRLGARKLMKWKIRFRTYASITAAAAIMGICLILAENAFGIGRLTLPLFVLAGVAIYGIALALFGEITEELKILKKLLWRFAKWK